MRSAHPTSVLIALVVGGATADGTAARGEDLCGTFLERDRESIDEIPATAQSMDLVDLDGDGINDVITADPIVSIRWGLGDGTFLAPDSLNEYAHRHFAYGDIDGDGLRDLIFLSSASISYARWLGGRRYAPAVTLSEGVLDRARAIVAGDLDGDGDTDLVVAAGQIFTPVNVFLNEGGGVFGAPAQPDSNVAFDGALGDLDADGDLDYVSRDNIGVTIHSNDGAGVFFESRRYFYDNSNDGQVVVADIDHDGDLDLATTGSGLTGGGTWFYVLRNNGSGVFATIRHHYAGLPLALGDFDGDRDLDAVTADVSSAERLQVHWNVGDLAFVDGPILTTRGVNVAAGQTDDDGDVDIIAAIVGAGQTDDAFARYDNLCRLCAGDVDGTERVDVGDLLLVLGNWSHDGGPGDANADGIVGIADLLLVLSRWGGCDPETGACCSRDGEAFVCAVMSEALCSGLPLSEYQGDESSCDVDACTGGCCLEAMFECDTMSRADCTASGGMFLGIGVACTTETCPAAFIAACCLETRACCAAVTEDACAVMGGTWLGLGGGCAECLPDVFSCCLPDGTCTQLEPLDCIDAGGTFEGCAACEDLDC